MERFLVGIEDVDARLEHPRRCGMTEMRSPCYSVMGPRYIQDILETNEQFIDGLKFKGGSASLMPKSFLKEIADMAHQHGMYMSTGGWAEHMLMKGPSAFKQYVQECKDVGFDTLELNTDFLNFQEDDLLRLIRLIKNEGLKAKPQLDVSIGDALSLRDLQTEMDALIKRAERLLEAGADMIMFDSDGITKGVDEWRTDLVAKMIGRLGLQKIMFEADEPESVQWFVSKYGPGVNLFVDHSHIRNLECLRTTASWTGIMDTSLYHHMHHQFRWKLHILSHGLSHMSLRHTSRPKMGLIELQ
ncbi:hypothetical protein GOP47_0002870 [Adiantum capillus-veneris]|uniref:Phosphosulfolactate synthase n=1 Tax=Adiantum capillus-veneris TaxID=13818 RepID=A0A9D4VCW1_ADICA|nr:hypothetical protein GOP47_0002870 [Adiantum capillus-veneris]